MIERWDDLRILLAVARGGTLTAASEALQVDPTTVTRRLKALEATVGLRLFDRLRGGVELTPAGDTLVATAEQWEAGLLDAERRLEGGREELSGAVRVALPELLALPWLPELVRLPLAHPGLTLELVVSNDYQSLARREADVAVRVTERPPEHLIAQEIGSIAGAVYAASCFDDRPLREVPWVGWHVADTTDSVVEAWRQEFSPDAPYSLRVSSYGTLWAAVSAGAGATYLPCPTGDALPDVSRRTEARPWPNAMWLLTHPDVRRSAKVRAVTAYLAEFLAAQSTG